MGCGKSACGLAAKRRTNMTLEVETRGATVCRGPGIIRLAATLATTIRKEKISPVPMVLEPSFISLHFRGSIDFISPTPRPPIAGRSTQVERFAARG